MQRVAATRMPVRLARHSAVLVCWAMQGVGVDVQGVGVALLAAFGLSQLAQIGLVARPAGGHPVLYTPRLGLL